MFPATDAERRRWGALVVRTKPAGAISTACLLVTTDELGGLKLHHGECQEAACGCPCHLHRMRSGREYKP